MLAWAPGTKPVMAHTAPCRTILLHHHHDQRTTSILARSRMQKQICLAVMITVFSCTLLAQTKPTGTPPNRAAGSTTAAGSTNPTAIIDTTAGKLTCTLFPKQAPIGVEN